jgi:hypothetical protein
MACILDAGQRGLLSKGHGKIPMKGPSEHEVVIASKFAHARVELAIIDEAARLADYEQREHHPTQYD